MKEPRLAVWLGGGVMLDVKNVKRPAHSQSPLHLF